jgi:hypothetical protein
MTEITLTGTSPTEFTAEIVKDDTTITIAGAKVTVVPYVLPVVVAPIPPAPVTLTGQTLTADKPEIHVGDTFTVRGVLNYSDGSSKPVTAYRLYNFNSKMVALTAPNSTTFAALAEGATTISNDNLGKTAKLNLTVLPATRAAAP